MGSNHNVLDIVTPYYQDGPEDLEQLRVFASCLSTQDDDRFMLHIIDDSDNEEAYRILRKVLPKEKFLYHKLPFNYDIPQWSTKFNYIVDYLKAPYTLYFSVDWSFINDTISKYIDRAFKLPKPFLCIGNIHLETHPLYGNYKELGKLPRYDLADNGMDFMVDYDTSTKYFWDEEFDAVGFGHQIPAWLKQLWDHGIQFYIDPSIKKLHRKHPMKDRYLVQSTESAKLWEPKRTGIVPLSVSRRFSIPNGPSS